MQQMQQMQMQQMQQQQMQQQQMQQQRMQQQYMQQQLPAISVPSPVPAPRPMSEEVFEEEEEEGEDEGPSVASSRARRETAGKPAHPQLLGRRWWAGLHTLAADVCVPACRQGSPGSTVRSPRRLQVRRAID